LAQEGVLHESPLDEWEINNRLAEAIAANPAR
jgi:hypothetical protein